MRQLFTKEEEFVLKRLVNELGLYELKCIARQTDDENEGGGGGCS